MKKTVSLILAALMVLCMFAGCTGNSGSTETTAAPKASEAPEVTSEPVKPTEKPEDVVKPTEVPTAQPTEVPTEKPTEVPDDFIPEAFIDIVYEGNTVKDAKGNATLTLKEGTEIGTYEVKLGDKDYTATALRGDADFEGIECVFDNLDNCDDMGEFLTKGSTFEMFLQIDHAISESGNLFSNSNGGGFNIMFRNATSQIQFNIGTNDQGSADFGASGYAYCQDPNAPKEDTVNAIPGELMHVVGVYDNDDNILLYLNGVLIEESGFGSGNYKPGGASENVLGIGYNSSYNSSLGKLTPYTMVKARIYNKALTEKQVIAAYKDCISMLTEK